MKYALDIILPEMKTIARITPFNAPTNKEAMVQAKRLFENWLYMIANGLNGMEKYDGEIISDVVLVRYHHGRKAEEIVRIMNINNDTSWFFS